MLPTAFSFSSNPYQSHGLSTAPWALEDQLSCFNLTSCNENEIQKFILIEISMSEAQS